MPTVESHNVTWMPDEMSKNTMSEETPLSLGYRMPAEWEPHAATWIAWPHQREDWPGKFAPISWVYTEIVRNLVRSEPVHILINDGCARRQASERLERGGVDLTQVTFHKIRTDRVWTRDTAPTFVVKEGDAPDLRVGCVDWKFNGWAKYENHVEDDRLPRKIAKTLDLPRWKAKATTTQGDSTRVVLEGGSIEVNGLGTVMTTEECLLSDVQARNPLLTREQVELALHQYLGTRHVIWLDQGIDGDDTHGHVDDLARFVGPKTVAIVTEPDPNDINHGPLAANRKRLAKAKDQDGKSLEVIELPMPRPVVFEGQRLPASYANFYIANTVVLVPTFNDPADRVALNILAEAFRGRDVIGIHAVDLVWGLGTLHCLTQQQPA